MTFSRTDTKVVKGIAIILMLYHHLFAFPDRIDSSLSYISMFSIDGNTISYWIGVFGKLCVALFIFLAGYGTYLSCCNKDSMTSPTYKKIKSLYTTYWQVFIIFIPVCMALDVSRVTKDFEDLIWNFSGLHITYNGEWWFFTPFVVLTLAYPLIKTFLDRKNSQFFSDVLIAFLICNIVVFVFPEVMQKSIFERLINSFFWSDIRKTIELFPVFLLGSIFAKYDVLSVIKRKFSGNLLNSCCSLLILFVAFYMRKHTNQYNGIFDFFYAPLVTISSIILLQGKLMKPFYWLLEKIGEESTIIWLCHSFYCYLILQKIVFAPKYSVLIFALLLAMSFATSILIKLIFTLLSTVHNKIKSYLTFKTL